MRRAGILLHPTSLPGPGPCGTLGSSSRAWLDWLEAAGCTLWSVLPLQPVGRDGSPYDSPSAFALDTRLIDIPDLVDTGLLPRTALIGMPAGAESIDQSGLDSWHQPKVRAAADAMCRDAPSAVEAFKSEQPWVAEWALYCALTQAHRVTSWQALPPPYRDRSSGALAAAQRAHGSAIEREIAAQLIVHQQWTRVRQGAESRGIIIQGDLPIFVSAEGAETWQRPELFRLNAQGRADPITGAPPDDFSAMGQVWNTPHYDWPAHERTDFAWWSQRFGSAMSRHDTVRVDHFRGFVSAWEVPASGDARLGTWGRTPGAALLRAAQQAVPGLQAFAEDLGDITDEVHQLRETLGWRGMKVLQFGFDGQPGNPYLPPWPTTDWVVTPGTHDNNTTVGWLQTAGAETQARVHAWLSEQNLPVDDPAGSLIRAAWASQADWAVATLQDVLRLGSWARMNTPGQTGDCWSWRARALPAAVASELRALNTQTGRCTAPADEETL
jgi:4-alpha-glucanotransferase